MVIIAENRREDLIMAAAKLFRQKGYAKATVRDLAKEVGIQSGSIFHHFKTKEDILVAVMEKVVLEITDKMTNALLNVKDVKEKIKIIVHSELDSILGATHDAMTVLFLEWRSLSKENQDKILALRSRYEQIWLDILEEAKQEGIISADMFILRRFLNGALGWSINWYREDGKLSIKELADQAVSLVIKP